jgi:hypothetical protein
MCVVPRLAISPEDPAWMQTGQGSFAGSATGRFMLPVPIPTGLAPTHIYAQAVQYGSAGGGASKILDVNIQD